jgi:hypothetical protein
MCPIYAHKKMEAVKFSEALVSYHITVRLYNSDDLDSNLHRREKHNSN